MLRVKSHFVVRAVFGAGMIASAPQHAVAGGLGSTGIANVYYQWTDRVGGVHPLGWAFASGLYDTTFSSGNAAGSGFLPSTGVGVFTGSAVAGSMDFYGSLYTSYGIGGTTWFDIRDSSNNVYVTRWPDSGVYNVPANTSPSFTHLKDDTTYAGTAHGMAQAFMFADQYAGFRLNASAPYFQVRYNSSTPTGAFYQVNTPNTPYISVGKEEWASWDVLMHEFGHHVAQFNNLNASPGGAHNIEGDNISGTGAPAALGAVQGSRLAWGEGFATYFGLSAVKSGDLATKVPGLPADEYDTWYDDYNSTGSQALNYNHLNFSMNAERPEGLRGGANANGTNAGTYVTRTLLGEGSEYSVLTALWDFYDSANEAHTFSQYHPKTQQWCSDRVTYGDVDAWNRLLIANGGAKTFRQYWNNLTTDMGTATGRGKVSGLATAQKDEAVAACGENLEAANIAFVPVTPDANAQLNTFRPQFVFDEQNNSNSSRFEFLVFANDWSSLVYTSPLFSDSDPTVINRWNYTPTVDLPMGTFWWVVLNSPAELTAADLTDRYKFYWSGARQFTIVPEPGAAALVLLMGIGIARRRRR